MFKGSCEFVRGVARIGDLPSETLPEIAFVGRSNVGKSSLINALLNRKDLARTSNTPGRTQQLNFFNLSDKIMIVDLPGYGYAKASKKDIKKWNQLIESYLQIRVSLRRVFILVDSRHGLKDSDREMMSLLDEAAVPYQVVLTKIDKTKPQELEKLISCLKEEFSNYTALLHDLVVTSSAKKKGIEALQERIKEIL